MPHDRFSITDILFKCGGSGGREGQVEQNIVAFAMFANLVSHLSLAPNIYLVHTTAGFGHPALDAVEHAVKSGLVQVGLDHTNQFIFAHGDASFPWDCSRSNRG